MIIRTVEFSSELFGGFTLRIEITNFKSLQELIDYSKSELLSILMKYNFISLIEKFKKCNFHIHTHNIDEIFENDNIVYICDHC